MFPRAELQARPPTIWRYREALGVAGDGRPVTLGEGMTPLITGRLGQRHALLKVDYLCPTGSYKDRGSSAMITQLKAWGIRRLIEDSSGNAGASIAAYAARAGIRADIFIPAETSPAKAAQIALYRGHLIRVPGTREDTARAAQEAAQECFYASHNWSPHFLAGMKTAAYEIAEQMNWRSPDWVVLPAGGGGLLCGLYMGFRDLLRAGFIDHMPKLVAVQAAACDPIHRAWTEGRSDVAAVQKGATAAEGISVAKPVRGAAVLQAIRDSGGLVVTVAEDEIWSVVGALGELGLCVEPTAAAAPAAFLQLCDRAAIARSSCAVVMLTGSGLKATDKIVQYLDAPSPVQVSG